MASGHDPNVGQCRVAASKQTDSFLGQDYPTSYLKTLMEDQIHGCSWFLNSEKFTKWKTTKNSFIWLLGGSGCGKTVLSSAVVQMLQIRQSNGGNTLEEAIQSLCSQLQNINTGDSASREEKYQSPFRTSGKMATLQELVEKFLFLVQKTGKVWLILDALDKCKRSQWGALFECIERIWELKQANVHFLLTSLPECGRSMAKSSIFGKTEKIIFIGSQPINDIIGSIHRRIKKRASNLRWIYDTWSCLPELYDVLGERTIGAPNWATIACQLDMLALETLTSAEDFCGRLESLPRDENRIYAGILRNIPEIFRPQATALLHLLTYSKRPLGIEEAVEFIKVGTSPPYFELDDKAYFNGNTLRYCSSLVNIVPVAWPSGKKSIELTLSNSSVRKYLTTARSGPFTIICGAPETMAIAKNCLSYILRMNSDLLTTELTEKFPFAEYCAKYWMHFASATAFPDETLRNMMRSFFRNESCYRSCYSLYRPDLDSSPELASPLYYASFGGFLDAAQDLLMRKADPNAKGGRYGTALQAASAQGHDHIVQLLVRNGAYVNSEGGIYGSAFHAALIGFGTVSGTSLDHGTNPNGVDGERPSVLCEASDRRYRNIITTLLDCGVEISANNNDDLLRAALRAALKVAQTNDRKEVVEFLLDKGEDLIAKSNAELKQLKEIIEISLDNGAYGGQEPGIGPRP
ncbi:hypothetical protein TWF730_007445 [Orbilia blumenaviensis]|uniref:Nephrocystin 3-like N-terminal domain-containing protein n=1 Tax=Orbilia blumenaviensis TaxID=1796055 RepID=A0AAV9VE85_9PEZI